MKPHSENSVSSKSTERASERSDSSLEKSSANLQAEASPAMSELNAMIILKRQENKAQRNERLSSQFRQTGDAKVGVITRQFGCSIELSDKRKGAVVVPGRSTEDLARLQELKSAANTDALIGEGGSILIPDKTSPRNGDDSNATPQLYDEASGEIHIGKRTYSRDQIVADASQSTKGDAIAVKHPFVLNPGDRSCDYPDGVGYIMRNDGTLINSRMENILVLQSMNQPTSHIMLMVLRFLFQELVMCTILANRKSASSIHHCFRVECRKM